MGKPKEAAIERFGKPIAEPGEDQVLEWKPSDKTGNRQLYVNFDARGAIRIIKVFALQNESVDPLDVLKKSNLLTFETGTYRDSSTNYLICGTKDKRNDIQFDISDAAVTFRAVIFKNLPDVQH